MIIWKGKEKLETRGDDLGNTVDWPCRAFRRAIEVSVSLRRSNNFLHLGLVWQHQWKSTGKWETSHVGNWEVFINDNWAWGEDHFYYDGPHCMFSLGFVHLHYPAKGGWCKKCLPDDNSSCANGDCDHSYHECDD